jgi:hypothetical protein
VFAYAARYGRQPLSEIRRMPLLELKRFVAEVSKIVEDENKSKEGSRG